MKKGLVLSLAAALTLWAAGLLAGQQICSTKTGDVGNGYNYELWTDGAGSTCMTVKGVDAQFEAQWTNAGDFLAMVGLKCDSDLTPSQIGTFSAAYACTINSNGNVYWGIHGWMTNPYIEYYIVDGWGTWQPPGLTSKGTVTIDGALYDVYRDTRSDIPDIGDSLSGYEVYWSVRKMKRTSGTISISEHFAQWEKLGLPLAQLYDVRLFVEGYQSSGSTVYTAANVVVSGGPTPTPLPTPTPTQSTKSGDVNGDGNIDITDALLVAQYSGGLPVPSTFILSNADVNKDGVINIVDALKIAQYSAGLITGF